MSTQSAPTPLAQVTEIISYDPATGEEIGRAPLTSAQQVKEAVKQARAAQPAWASLSYRERGRIILKARLIVLEEIDEIATLISRETGKPVAEAISMESYADARSDAVLCAPDGKAAAPAEDRHRPVWFDGPLVAHRL